MTKKITKKPEPSKNQNSKNQNCKPNKTFKLTDQIDSPLDLASHLPYQIAIVGNLLALNRDWKIREVSELEPREMRVLLTIGSYMPIKAADVAYLSRLDSYTVSRAVKILQTKDLIDFTSDPSNKNIKIITLNEKGQSTYQKLASAIDSRSIELESVLSEKEIQSLFKTLKKIEDKSEKILAEQALDFIEDGRDAPNDQKELIRWYKRQEKV